MALASSSISLESQYLKHLTNVLDRQIQNSDSSSEETSDEEVCDHTSSFIVDTKPSTSSCCGTELLKTKKNKMIEYRKEQSGTVDKQFQLASTLHSEIDVNDVYVNAYPGKKTEESVKKNKILSLRASTEDELLKKSVLQPGYEKQFTVPPYIERVCNLKKQRREERKKSKGSKWYNLPATELTDEIKNDLQVIQFRKALDPKRFYKKNDLKTLPKYFQIGTIVESPADFYHSRVPKKERKRTIVEELLADAEFKKYNKKKYAEIMANRPQRHKGALKHMKRLKKRK
ncbi:deoxynucleotidyltransferase terminal-interacting protein 2-like [Limulus polyphemus]|uniref:Deoxynucleotidyltransferase terminal-interacting protein 2-like n=1 Tax=Limulus polyphemus TaxID=6850 RepID=A0ABM1BKR3_LIMPO|nr:deoxynucleotidyltransferase terminal-interacting protein 2-like [Limulus polyphemus]